jgi:uncharacterized protein
MTDAWDEMRKAKEEQYFHRENEKALQRMKEAGNTAPRLSPITGKPMERVAIEGIVVDKCVDSGGIWLDHGELEQIIEARKNHGDETWAHSFFTSLFKRSGTTGS